MPTDLFKKARSGCSVGTDHREAGVEKGPRLEDRSQRAVRGLGGGSGSGKKRLLVDMVEKRSQQGLPMDWMLGVREGESRGHLQALWPRHWTNGIALA